MTSKYTWTNKVTGIAYELSEEQEATLFTDFNELQTERYRKQRVFYNFLEEGGTDPIITIAVRDALYAFNQTIRQTADLIELLEGVSS